MKKGIIILSVILAVLLIAAVVVLFVLPEKEPAAPTE